MWSIPPVSCVVISPLIALMQDQAASMREIGVEAAFFNSSLTYDAQQDVKRRAARGDLQLLYLSPERAVRQDLLEWLQQIPIGFQRVAVLKELRLGGLQRRYQLRKIDQEIAAAEIDATAIHLLPAPAHANIACGGNKGQLFGLWTLKPRNIQVHAKERAPRQRRRLGSVSCRAARHAESMVQEYV